MMIGGIVMTGRTSGTGAPPSDDVQADAALIWSETAMRRATYRFEMFAKSAFTGLSFLALAACSSSSATSAGAGSSADNGADGASADNGADGAANTTTDGGGDEGPSPQELLAASVASCTAVTMRMYANRKGWDIGQLEVDCEYEAPERGASPHFNLVLRIPDCCTQEQVDALRRIAGKCPVHRALEGPSTFEDRIEFVSPMET